MHRAASIAFINRKGGVGKTTTTENLALALAQASKLGIAGSDLRTLAIDLDSQANLSQSLGVPPDRLSPSIAEILYDGDFTGAIRATSVENLFVIPASKRLAHEEATLHAHPESVYRLREVTDVLQAHYDVILIDCPPALGVFFKMAMLAAGTFVVPVTLEHFSEQGIDLLLQDYADVRTEYPDAAGMLGIVLTMVDYRLQSTRDREGALRAKYGEAVFESLVPRNAKVEVAQSHGRSIYDVAPRARGAVAYRHLAAELVRRAHDLLILPPLSATPLV